jgi:hypothetical protein
MRYKQQLIQVRKDIANIILTTKNPLIRETYHVGFESTLDERVVGKARIFVTKDESLFPVTVQSMYNILSSELNYQQFTGLGRLDDCLAFEHLFPARHYVNGVVVEVDELVRQTRLSGMNIVDAGRKVDELTNESPFEVIHLY